MFIVMSANFRLDLFRNYNLKMKCRKNIHWQIDLSSLVIGLSFVASALVMYDGVSRDYIVNACISLVVIFAFGSAMSALLAERVSGC